MVNLSVVTLIVVAVFGLGMLVQRLLTTLERLEERIAKLEEGQRTRNPWKTNDGLEDAMSISWDVIHRAAEVLDYTQRRTEQVIRTLQVIRSNPDQYDSEKPNGKKARR